MRTPFDPRPLDPAPDPAHRVDSQETTPAATLAAVEAAMLVVDAAGIVEVGVRADAAALVEARSARVPDAGSAATASSATEGAVVQPVDAAPASLGPTHAITPAPGRTLVKVAQFAATAAALAFLAFGGRVPDVVAATRAYFPRTRLAELLRVPSSARRVVRPPASVPKPVPAAIPAVSRPSAPAAAPAQETVSARSPQAVATAPARVPRAVPTPKPDSRSAPRRRGRPQGAEASTDAAAALPAGITEQQRQEYYLRLMGDGHRLYQSGWYGPAMGRFRQGAAVKPQSQNAHLWIARSAMRTGRYDVARAAAERAIAIAPNNDAAREARALLDQLKVVERERL